MLSGRAEDSPLTDVKLGVYVTPRSACPGVTDLAIPVATKKNYIIFIIYFKNNINLDFGDLYDKK